MVFYANVEKNIVGRNDKAGVLADKPVLRGVRPPRRTPPTYFRAIERRISVYIIKEENLRRKGGAAVAFGRICKKIQKLVDITTSLCYNAVVVKTTSEGLCNTDLKRLPCLWRVSAEAYVK